MKQFKSILLGISLFLLHSCNLLDVDTVSKCLPEMDTGIQKAM